MTTCHTCEKHIPCTTTSPLIAIYGKSFHYVCFRKKYVDPMFEGEPEVEEKESSLPSKVSSPTTLEAQKSDSNDSLAPVNDPLKQTQVRPGRHRIVELKDGVATGWSHEFSSKDYAEKKAYRLNLNGGAMSYLVEPVEVAGAEDLVVAAVGNRNSVASAELQ